MASTSETPAVAAPAVAGPAAAAPAEATPAPAAAAGAAAPADIDNRILDQVEFYFGDSNLPHDKHLSGLMKENKEGWVSIAHIATFKRLQQLTKDPAVVVNALRKSKSLLQVSEDGTKVRRVEPLPTNTDNTARTVYVKGFPAEASLDSIRDFFRTVGDIRCVRMRHTKDKAKTFKGSVFAEFSTEDEAKRVAATPLKLPSSDTPLITHTKAEYVAKKIAEGKSEEKPSKKKGTKRGRDEKEGDAKEGETKEEEKPEAKVIVPDLIISIDGIPAGSSREDLQAFITEAGAKVKYTDFSRGETKAYIRLEEPADGTGAKLASATVAALVEAKTQLAGVTPELKALTGDEEKEYWTKVWSRQYDSKRGRARGGGRGRGGKGRGRGGKGDRGRGGKGKKQKTTE